jgi:hypothetical protein
VAAVKSIVTVLAEDGLKTYPALAFRVVKVDPLVLPCTVSVWVRVCHAAAGGSLRTAWLTLTAEPRSTWSHCGNALLLLSQ